MRVKTALAAVLLVFGAWAQAQRTYLEAGTTAVMDLTFGQGTSFGLFTALEGGVRDLAGPFGVGGRFGLNVQQGGAAFELGLQGLFHFGRYGSGISPLVGLGFRVFFGGGQTLFGLGGGSGHGVLPQPAGGLRGQGGAHPLVRGGHPVRPRPAGGA
ncbi:hypothetical protein TthSNM66_19870 [Thermus thermophilus]|uniref:hypothetical protein n=1 Tax=Thermus thermophilus TaxID=274 RepID=UPI001FCABFE7|nr:hypothetical protein [Thermus thermophilus]BDG27351.1 hypothetical protein TthSNM66_19870 [Thermus thermophilus]BDG29671.1 hypothetical protein TthSNM76_18810 [Thermus thermophilus]